MRAAKLIHDVPGPNRVVGRLCKKCGIPLKLGDDFVTAQKQNSAHRKRRLEGTTTYHWACLTDAHGEPLLPKPTLPVWETKWQKVASLGR